MSMSQVPPPREFKFVGAFSRKRRRRDGSVRSTNPKDCALQTPMPRQNPAAPPAIPAASSKMALGRNLGGKAPASGAPAEGTPPTATQPPGIQASLAATPLTAEQDANAVQSQMILHDPGEDINLCNEVDWSCLDFMDPFLDTGPSSSVDPFSQTIGLPMGFGPDISLVPLEDVSSDENSPHDDYIEPVLAGQGNVAAPVEPSIVNDIVLPSLTSKEAPSNISLTITQLLTRYDQEFCIMPLTHDFDANPFRSDAQPGRGSQLLLHSILALSYKHINRDTGSCAVEARTYKKKALHLLRNTDRAPQASPLQASFLDAVLVLMTLDCATSAHGPWTSYLKRAYKMIKATESPHLQKTPRMQARLEMLLWWDVTLALTSRQGCVLSESTILSLFDHDKTGNETFYSVSGCPEALFRHMIRLGSYAREFELVANMTCARFNLEPVLEVRNEIRRWIDPEYGDFSDQYISEPAATQGCDVEDAAHYKEDLHHCAEAWRYGLLTYIARVFEWQRGQPAPPILGFLARKTLSHVSSCRSMSTLQKQLLLPVFLAGCETDDAHLREVARSYCCWWNERSRYDMFLTAHAMLEEVWLDDDPQSWWGSIIDQKSRLMTGSGEARQYLFG